MSKHKCMFCNKRFSDKQSLEDHLGKIHTNQLKLTRNGITEKISPARFYFNHRNKKLFGICVECGKETQWNEFTGKYNRYCSDDCKHKYTKRFEDRMRNKYGKERLTDDPNHQKRMLMGRSISGVYKWSDGKHSFNYTDSYELDFIEFMDKTINWDPMDIEMPASTVMYYKYNGKRRFYIPDVYIRSIDMFIEIKASDNKHYRARDIKMEELKDAAMSDVNYIKVMDKDYSELMSILSSKLLGGYKR